MDKKKDIMLEYLMVTEDGKFHNMLKKIYIFLYSNF